MKKSARMMMMAKRDGEERRYDMPRDEVRRYGEPDRMPMPQNAFYDDRGRRHYDNGRYAPQNAARHIPVRYDEREYGDTTMGFRYPYPILPSYRAGYDFDVDGQIGNMRGHASGSMIRRDRHTDGMSQEMTRDEAERWVEQMENADGSRGAHWKYDQAVQFMKQHNIDCDPTKFYVALNMMYSDYYEAAKKMNVNTVDFYCYLAKAFLDDKDAGENKLEKYYEYVVK